MNIQQGVLISGICQGFRTEEYNGNTNFYAGFIVESVDDYGSTLTEKEEVRLGGQNLEKLKQQAATNKGKHCIIAVSKEARVSQYNRAYMSTSVLPNSEIIALQQDK